MKKKLLLLSLLAAVSMLTASAQDGSLPMLEESRAWNMLSLHPGPIEECEYKDIHGNPCMYYGERQYLVKGDTVINGMTYKKIYREGSGLIECMRQDGSRIYMSGENGNINKDVLAYDFSLNERDTIAIAGEWLNRLVVDKVDTVKVDGISRRRLTMNCIYVLGDEESEALADIWVEGIGGIVSSPCFFNQWHMTGSSTEMSICIQDSKKLFSGEDFYAPAWKGETVSVKAIRNSSTVTQSSVFYDLQGRRHSGKPTKGVYIQNGRMWLTK